MKRHNQDYYLAFVKSIVRLLRYEITLCQMADTVVQAIYVVCYYWKIRG